MSGAAHVMGGGAIFTGNLQSTTPALAVSLNFAKIEM
jgi:hypothetical protein